jgi:hypothetical protein
MPFDSAQFLEVFALYNAAVFPAQVVLLAAALVAVRLAARGDRASSKTAAAILGLLWLWMGVVYHWLFFSQINGAAVVFGAFFVLQSLIFIYAGVIGNDVSFRRPSGVTSMIGTTFLIYALIVYPLIGMAVGHSYPYSPTFGLPCPTTIFTFGLLLRSARKVPLYVLAIPLVWSLLGASAAYSFGIWEDFGLIVAGGLGIWLLAGDRLARAFRTRGAGLTLKEN